MWIKLEKRKPDEGAYVFATGWDYDRPGYKRHYSICQFQSGIFVERNGDVNEYITDWMPIVSPEGDFVTSIDPDV